MKTTKLFVAVVLALGTFPAFADQKTDAKTALNDIQKTLGFVPDFLKALPEAALPGTWDEMKSLELSANSVIPQKYKELIGLAVSAQIPCRYCIFAHTEFAKANGAQPNEIGVAVAESGLTRHWSTFLNGTQMDPAKLRAEVTDAIDHLKKKAPNAPEPTPINVIDAESAYEDAQQRLGMVPAHLKAFPANAFAGAWKMMRDVQLRPDGPVPAKYIYLMSLAVAAQIPCESCVVADTEFAKFNGASDAEITEAVAMGSLTRQMSTLINGMQINEAKFKADVLRMAKPKKIAIR